VRVLLCHQCRKAAGNAAAMPSANAPSCFSPNVRGLEQQTYSIFALWSYVKKTGVLTTASYLSLDRRALDVDTGAIR